MMLTIVELECVPDHELTARLYQLRVRERAQLVEFLVYLAELDRRKLYLDAGFPSCFQFCLAYLGLTNGSAFRRVVGARLLARFPVIAEYLRDGRLSLTTLVELRDVLAEERLDEILGRAAGRTEKEVKELVAALRPRPAPMDLFRRLPMREATGTGLMLPVGTSGPEVHTGVAPEQPAREPPRRGGIEPISEELRVLRVTVGREFAADLEKVRAALSHQFPDGRLETVLHHCLRVTLEACEKRRRGTGRAARREPSGEGRYIPAAVRDDVWRRDDGRCGFVSEDGRRCGATSFLEIHHIVPFALGGPAIPSNLGLRCSLHNRRHAEKELGAERMARAIASGAARRKRRNAGPGDAPR
jgi:5-methylcytosine-specific restriction endonuclease McrA